MNADPGEERDVTGTDPRRACAWPRRLFQGPARLIAREELKTWILFEDERLLVINLIRNWKEHLFICNSFLRITTRNGS